MSDCCTIPSNQLGTAGVCPVCGQKGKPVDLNTVRALTRRNFPNYGELTQGFICLNPEDKTVYYFNDLKITVNQKDVVTNVGFKSQSYIKTVCYCFQHTADNIIDDYIKNNISNIENDVRQKVKEKRCSCEVSNPKGKCCLGDIRNVIKGVQIDG